MKANSQKQRCLALRNDLLQCIAQLVMEWSGTWSGMEEVVMTSRPVGQEGHCFLKLNIFNFISGE